MPTLLRMELIKNMLANQTRETDLGLLKLSIKLSLENAKEP